LLGPVALFEDGDTALHLRCDRGARQAPVGTETAVIAEDAAADRHRAIYIWTGEARVDGHAVHGAAETLFQESAESVITAPPGKFGWHASSCRHQDSSLESADSFEKFAKFASRLTLMDY